MRGVAENMNRGMEFYSAQEGQRGLGISLLSYVRNGGSYKRMNGVGKV